MNETRQEPARNNDYSDIGAPSALLNLSEKREKPGFQLNSSISEECVGLGLCASLSFWIVRPYYHLTPESLHAGRVGFKPGLKPHFREVKTRRSLCHGERLRE